MAEISFKVGEPVVLHLHLGSGETGKHVRAFIKRSDGTELATVDLADRGGGTHSNDSDFLMPDASFLIVVYRVFDDVERTVISDDFGDAIDLIIKRDVFQAVQNAGGIIAAFEQTTLEAAFGQSAISINVKDQKDIDADFSAEVFAVDFKEKRLVGVIS